ncbi:MAG: hypothetical protein A2X18_07605 [Bacteroidetes bacterium GWF2_40_14]|nr:MAG: hypothetical protein A2X18_07605 [Bacteroidetes bacterium GWF2_40_14]
MKIYTSYFGNLRNLAKSGICPINIALWQPKFFGGFSILILAPKRYMLNDSLTEEQYTNMYKKDVLAQVNPSQIISMIKAYGNGNDVALLCYEKPSDFCHRHIFAEWFTRTTGIEVTEFGVSAVKEEKPKIIEQTLF